VCVFIITSTAQQLQGCLCSATSRSPAPGDTCTQTPPGAAPSPALVAQSACAGLQHASLAHPAATATAELHPHACMCRCMLLEYRMERAWRPRQLTVCHGAFTAVCSPCWMSCRCCGLLLPPAAPMLLASATHNVDAPQGAAGSTWGLAHVKSQWRAASDTYALPVGHQPQAQEEQDPSDPSHPILDWTSGPGNQSSMHASSSTATMLAPVLPARVCQR